MKVLYFEPGLISIPPPLPPEPRVPFFSEVPLVSMVLVKARMLTKHTILVKGTSPAGLHVEAGPLGGRLDFMLKQKVNTAQRLLREQGARAIAGHLWFKLKARRSTVCLDNSRFGLEGIHGISRIAMLNNSYELPERRAVARYLRRDLPVVELGGSIGVVACVTNKLLKDQKAHLVVEANPLAIPHLQRNKRRNRCQFEIINRAVAYGSDTVTFRPSSNMCGNSVTSAGDEDPVTIPTAQLRELLRHRGFGRFNLVCDIEGMEFDLVNNEADVLKNADTIIMETHARLIGEHKLSSMMIKLQDLGFRVIEETGYVVVLQE